VAEVVVAAVCRDAGVGWQVVSIADDPDLAARYGELIPVVFVDGREHAVYHVKPRELATALRQRQ
jgi:hypothetical protein